MDSPEQQLLLTVSRGDSAENRLARLEELLAGNLEWQLAWELALGHQISGLLHFYLEPFADHRRSSFFESLRQKALEMAVHGLFLESELLKFTDLLTEKEIPFIPIKGPLLAELLYENPAMRASGDLDILFHPKDLRRVIEAVEQIDYFPPQSYSEAVRHMVLTQANHYHVHRADSKSIVELHWDWLPTSFGLPVVNEATWERTRRVVWRGRELRVLGPEDLLLLLTVHGTKHRWPIVKWAADVSRLVALLASSASVEDSRDAMQDFEWDRFLGLCEHPDLKRMVGVGLLTVERLLGPRLPEDVRQEFAADSKAVQLARRLADEVFSKTGRLSGLEQTLYRLHFRSRSSDRFRFLRKTIFSPSPIEDETFRLPETLQWSYPLLRVGRLTLKYLRPRNWRRC